METSHLLCPSTLMSTSQDGAETIKIISVVQVILQGDYRSSTPNRILNNKEQKFKFNGQPSKNSGRLAHISGYASNSNTQYNFYCASFYTLSSIYHRNHECIRRLSTICNQSHMTGE